MILLARCFSHTIYINFDVFILQTKRYQLFTKKAFAVTHNETLVSGLTYVNEIHRDEYSFILIIVFNTNVYTINYYPSFY